jgi:hypothetical protein
MAAIRQWRIVIREERRKGQRKVDALQKAYDKALREHNSTMRLESFFQAQPGRFFHSFIFLLHLSDICVLRKAPTFDPPPLPIFPPQPRRPIIKEICANSLGAFSGFGRHTANDFLFLHAIFPGMPSDLLCDDDNVFEDFVSALGAYLRSFTTERFYARVVNVANSVNPFAFSETSNDSYMKHHIQVFRRVKAKVEHSLYIRYCRLGYLDPDHIMGALVFLLVCPT